MMKIKQDHSAPAINREGFSLIEVLIFTLLTSMVLIALSYATMISVSQSIASENKTKSTRYVQQAHEWLKGQKESDWNLFVDSLDAGKYCINTLPASIDLISSQIGPCGVTDFTLDNKFKRELNILSINNDETEVSYTITNYWREGKNILNSQVSSLLAQWE